MGGNGTGLPVGVTYRSDAAGARSVVGEIEEAGGRAVAIQADVGDVERMERCFAELEDSFEWVSVLVNNAGTRVDGLSMQLDDEAWGEVLDTNLSAAYRCMRRALTPMSSTVCSICR